MEMGKYSRFLWRHLIIFFMGIWICGGFAVGENRPKKNQTNILLITIDTLRPDRLSCYGGGFVKTPQIDSLAERGVLFSRAYAHNPETLPSHANILLGVTALTHGVHDNVNFVVRPEFLNLAKWLKDRRYSTGAVIGAFPLDSRFGLTQGFDLYDDNYGAQGSQQFVYAERKAEVVVARARGWLENQNGPWFLWVHCFDPHQPYDPPEPFRTQYKKDRYSGEVAYVDEELEKLFDYLKEKNLDEKTLIILTGDHGESLGEHGEKTHGYFAYNATLWVPLVIKAPGIKPGRIEQEVCHIDIFPTVCDLLGIDKPGSLQGLSLVPAMEGKTLPRRSIYFESLMAYYSRGWAPLRGLIEGKKKYIESPLSELYDLDKDFSENDNLAEGTKLDEFKRTLAELIRKQSAPSGQTARQAPDRETREKLQSLGYISSPQAPPKKSFTVQDDLKTLLPYHSRWQQATALYQNGQVEEAIVMMKQIIAERKDFDVAYTHLANYYKEQRRINEAVDILRQGYENNPANFRIIENYGIFLVEAGRYDEAITVLRKGLATIDYDPEAWNYLGVAYWNKGNYDEAQKAYERALALDSNYPIVFNNLGSLDLSIFLKSQDAQAYARAVENFKRAIDLDPKYASAYNGLGAALKMGGDVDGAIDNWKKAVELKPDFGFALYNLGLSYLAKGDKTEALDYFTRYKDKFYSSLPLPEREKLDALIQKCNEKE
jgi:arylsulfatase A-like enzyme/Flp pilus assembly protein TadD